MESSTIPKRLCEIATRLKTEWPGEFDNWATWITIAATRIEHLEVALKDAVSTACENARERDNFRHKHSIVESELTANERVLSELLEWQPIESAPRDGGFFIAGRFTGEKRNQDGLQAVDRWHDRALDGYEGLGKFNAAYWPATHWYPLPPPPPTGGA
jgi:hypothetical protein